MGGEADAAFIALGANTDFALPKSILQLATGVAGYRERSDRCRKARIGGRGESDVGRARESVAKPFGQHGVPAFDAVHADTVDEAQSRTEAVDNRDTAG